VVLNVKKHRKVIKAYIYSAIVMLAIVSSAQAQTPVLSGDNVSLAATHLDASFDWKKRSLEYLKTNQAQQFASMMHDPARVEAARVIAEADLRKIASEKLFKRQSMSKQIAILSVAKSLKSKNKYTVTMEPAFPIGSTFVDASASKIGFAELAYSVLLANPSLTTSLEVEEKIGKQLQFDFLNKRAWGLMMTAEFELVRISQGKNVHAVIRVVEWKREGKDAPVISTVSDNRPAKDLIASRMLSEGLTLEIPLDHEGSYGSHRLNEHLIEDTAGQCNELPRERGHRVFSCLQYLNSGVNGKVRTKYVGGRGVVIELFLSRDAAPKDEASLISFLSNDFRMSPEAIKTWKWWQARAEVIVSKQDALKPDGTRPYLIATSRDYKKMLAGAKEYGVLK
jgi:hypothetical protein